MLVVLFLIILGVWPMYNVWAQRMHGEAELARATQNRRVRVQEAQAKFEAADYDAKTDVRRAQGVAQANKIIGDSLKNNEAYLRYLFVNGLENTHDQVIYVPTEAQLPVLEATRRVQAPPPPQQ